MSLYRYPDVTQILTCFRHAHLHLSLRAPFSFWEVGTVELTRRHYVLDSLEFLTSILISSYAFQH